MPNSIAPGWLAARGGLVAALSFKLFTHLKQVRQQLLGLLNRLAYLLRLIGAGAFEGSQSFLEGTEELSDLFCCRALDEAFDRGIEGLGSGGRGLVLGCRPPSRSTASRRVW